MSGGALSNRWVHTPIRTREIKIKWDVFNFNLQVKIPWRSENLLQRNSRINSYFHRLRNLKSGNDPRTDNVLGRRGTDGSFHITAERRRIHKKPSLMNWAWTFACVWQHVSKFFLRGTSRSYNFAWRGNRVPERATKNRQFALHPSNEQETKEWRRILQVHYTYYK